MPPFVGRCPALLSSGILPGCARALVGTIAWVLGPHGGGVFEHICRTPSGLRHSSWSFFWPSSTSEGQAS